MKLEPQFESISLLGEVFRDQNITKTAIVSKSDFQNLNFGFKSEVDPFTGYQIEV